MTKEKRGVLALVVFLFCISAAHALYEEKIFDARVTSEVPFIIDGEEYEAVYNRYSNVTIVFFPNGYNDVVDLNNQSCSQQWIYRACVYDPKLISRGRELPWDVHESNVNITFRLELYASYAKLNVEREFDQTQMYSQEMINGKITVSNEGEMEAENVTIFDEFPDEFLLVSVKGCEKEGNAVIWKGELASEKQKICEYVLKAIDATTYSSTLDVSYSFLGKTVSKSDTKTLEIIEEPLELSYTPKIIRDANVTADYSLNLSVLDDVEIHSLKIYIPEQFALDYYKNDLVNRETYLVWEGDLDSGEKKEILLLLRSRHVGNFSIDGHVLYTANGILRNRSLSTPFDVRLDLPYLNTEHEGNEVILRIVNPTQMTFYNIEIGVYGDEGELASYKVNELFIKRYQEFIDYHEGHKSYLVTIRTPYGQYVTQNYSVKETIRVISDGIEEVEETTTSLPAEQVVDDSDQNDELDATTIALIAGIMGILIFISLILFKVFFGGDSIDLADEEALAEEELSESRLLLSSHRHDEDDFIAGESGEDREDESEETDSDEDDDEVEEEEDDTGEEEVLKKKKKKKDTIKHLKKEIEKMAKEHKK